MRCLLLLLVLQVPGPADRSDDVLRDNLTKSYADKLFTVRDFISGSRLRYDADGKFLSGGEPGAFTLDGSIHVDSVNVREDRIELRGRHVYLRFNPGTRRLEEFPTENRMRLDFARTPDVPPEAGIADALLTLEELPQVLPAYWRKFITGPPTLSPLVDPVTGVVIPRAIEDEGLVPQATRQIAPSYPRDVRNYGVAGSVILRVIVDEQGKPRVGDLVRPLGFGLDQAAIDAVNQWEFEPAKKDGKPVKVYFRVRVNFNAPQ